MSSQTALAVSALTTGAIVWRVWCMLDPVEENKTMHMIGGAVVATFIYTQGVNVPVIGGISSKLFG